MQTIWPLGIQAVSAISEWITQSGLKFASEKNRGIVFARKKRVREINLHLMGRQIRIIKAARYLSIHQHKEFSGSFCVMTATVRTSKTANAVVRILAKYVQRQAGKSRFLMSTFAFTAFFGPPGWFE